MFFSEGGQGKRENPPSVDFWAGGEGYSITRMKKEETQEFRGGSLEGFKIEDGGTKPKRALEVLYRRGGGNNRGRLPKITTVLI